jgi:hypothetical protein
VRCVARSSYVGRGGGGGKVTETFVLTHSPPVILMLVVSDKHTELSVEKDRPKNTNSAMCWKMF